MSLLHSAQYGKPSLVCDFMELYRYLIDDFLIQYCLTLRAKDFIVKTENLAGKKTGKREYLNNKHTKELMRKLDRFFDSTVPIPRIKVGKKQTVETLINEEALCLGKYLRDERKGWAPRIASP